MKTINLASKLLMPVPVFIEDKKGTILISKNTAIKCDKKFTELKNSLVNQFSFNSTNELIEFIESAELKNEEYHLDINETKIVIAASSEIGFYHAMQTIRQLMISCDNNIPCCFIKDHPKYSWRGFMIDCSRNFVSIDELKKLIDTASLHHLNIFHWHLSDDQGWRLEIPSLPKLTNIGAKRQHVSYEIPMEEFDYYSEKQVLDLIEYANERFITIVPEIEFPGHTRALLAAYPQYGCKSSDYKVVAHWGIFNEVICVGNDDVLDFIEKIINYVAKIFPSKYIHIGGDECPTESWKTCPKCQNKMKSLGYSDERQLQGYITSKICKMVDDANKIPIGWDEVLEGTEELGLPESLVVMSWRGSVGGIKASSLNHEVIMCPNTDGCYFDYKNYDSYDEPGNLGVTTIKDVCNYSPTTPDMNDKQKNMILGGQGNVWTEKIPFGKNLEYMLYPRLSVLAERLWNPQDLNSVNERRDSLTYRLRQLDINCYSGPSN